MGTVLDKGMLNKIDAYQKSISIKPNNVTTLLIWAMFLNYSKG